MDDTALRPKPMPGGHSATGRTESDRKSAKWRLGGSGGNPRGRRSPGPPGGKGHRTHALRRRGRRLTALLSGLLVAVVLVLSGIGLGTVSATVIGMSKLAEMRKAAPPPGALGGPGGPAAAKPSAGGGGTRQPTASPGPGGPHRSTAPARPAALGVEAVDAERGPGALLVGVHVPGPGYTAGLVRGDTLLAFGGTRVRSAAALASAVAAARPGKRVTLTVRHEGGGRQVLSVRPGIVT
ncbi:PDZ domain-containing protein [Streptomyces kanamyceticus]|uniref:PDZ domain-containing protein n=1 Tax=Streptomyces kanamyceticus TaxID=1967 RepID=A0A5J6GAU6_STRKN|nr:PDZ domain-containing protein [Streptomyces kanamyceticus]QEU91085.1 PDZ domain-containing protein [Streptomyces kanamyceticus]